MNQHTTRRMAWSIAVVSIVVVMLGLVISVLALLADDGHLGPFSHQFFTPIATVTFCVIGALVASRHPRNPIGWIFVTVGVFSALNMFSVGYILYDELAIETGSLPGTEFLQWLGIWDWIPATLLPVTFILLLFPDGGLPSRRWRPIAWAAGLGITAFSFSMAFHPGPLEEMGLTEPNRFGIPGAGDVMEILMAAAAVLLLVGGLGSVASVIVRFRNSKGILREQLKWLMYAGFIVIAGGILGSIMWAIWPDDPLAGELSIVISSATVTSIVSATGIAILRYRLWDIDIVINRTLVYGTLTAVVIGAYIILVGSLGALFQARGSLPISLVATGFVAIGFQPLRDRLQRAVNRFLYGDRDDPYAVLSRLGQRLEATFIPEAVLPTIVETVAQALKLPYAAIALKQDDGFQIATEFGLAPKAHSEMPVDGDGGEGSDCLILPLVYQMETIGHLILAPRAPDDSFSPADQRLLADIAHQVGVAAHAVQLTADLQHSRERLVTAREEERRRLRRDLHDGLGPILAATLLKLEAADNLVDHDPDAVHKLHNELKTQVQTALADIRRIAYNLRPPALDELGLVPALREHIATHNLSEALEIDFDAPAYLPPLPAAVEVAAYRIALEAITNVERHASAHHCHVHLSLGEGLCLEITDDGRGLQPGIRSGVGLTSMRERALELGGSCRFQSLGGGGTQVVALLPLADMEV